MKAIKDLLSNKRFQIAVIAGSIALSAIVMGLLIYQFQYRLGGDAISYISIGGQYADGHFGSAINAFWSPMVSWLMAPFLALGASGSVAYLLVNTLAALFTLMAGAWWIWKWTNGSFLATFIFVGTMIPFLFGAIRILTPDLLVVAWAVLFWMVLHRTNNLIVQADKKAPWRIALPLGAVGAVGYFMKLYTLPVFLLVIAIWAVLLITRQGKQKFTGKKLRQALVVPVLSVLFLFVVSLPWIVALSVKYGYVTMGSSFSVNMEHKFNYDEPQEEGSEFAIPPNEHAVTPREDPTPPRDQEASHDTGQTSEAESSSGSLRDRVQHYAGERLKAFPFYLNRIASVWPFTMPIMLIAGFAILIGAVTYRRHSELLFAWLIGGAYFLGYTAIAGAATGGGNTRYYWPVFVMSLVVACVAVPYLLKKIMATKQKLRKVIFVCLMLTLPFISATHYILGIKYTSSIPILNPAAVGESERSAGVLDELLSRETPQKPPMLDLAEQLQGIEDVPKYSKIVGDNRRMVARVAYYLKSQAYGMAGAGNYYNLENPDKTLRELGVRYVIHFTPEGGEIKRKIKGTIIGEFQYTTGCSDDKDAVEELCNIRVVKIGDE